MAREHTTATSSKKSQKRAATKAASKGVAEPKKAGATKPSRSAAPSGKERSASSKKRTTSSRAAARAPSARTQAALATAVARDAAALPLEPGGGELAAVMREAPRREERAAHESGEHLLQGIVSAGEESPRRASDQSGKYVYCIIQTSDELRFGAIGIGAEASEVHTVRYRDIAAVVSDAPIEVYDPTRENVLAHERVNETVMRHHTVIPMSFGTVFNTREDINELLRSAYDAFRDVLTKMQNKLEFGLKVLWDPDQIITGLEAEDENLRRLKQEISSQRGSTYFARMQYGRLVDQLLQDRSEAYVSQIFGALRDVSVASRANKPIGDRMILNAAFLVSRDHEEEFDATVSRVGSELEQLTFRYTGPWPPYNFVNIRLKLERAREGE